MLIKISTTSLLEREPSERAGEESLDRDPASEGDLEEERLRLLGDGEGEGDDEEDVERFLFLLLRGDLSSATICF